MSGLTPPKVLSYEGQVAVPFITRTFDPTSSNYQFDVPTVWVNTAAKKGWILLAKPMNVADWFPFAGSTSVTETLTGNSGGAVSPAGNNINVFGSGSITSVGTPLSSTLTLELTGLTNHAVQVGSATTTLTQVGPNATAGIPLISQGATTDPAFGTATVPGGGTGATTLTGVLIGNGASAVTGNPITQHDVLIGGASNAINSVSPSTAGFVLTSNGVSADPSFQNTSSAGKVVVMAQLATPVSNVTGDGTIYTVVFDTAPVNTSSSYNTSTGVFTAPANGNYLISGALSINGITSSHTAGVIIISSSTGNQIADRSNYFAEATVPAYSASFSGWASLTAGQTIQIQLQVSNGTKVITVEGSIVTDAYCYLAIAQIS
jgi:hypothetical protein